MGGLFLDRRNTQHIYFGQAVSVYIPCVRPDRLEVVQTAFYVAEVTVDDLLALGEIANNTPADLAR